MLLTSLGVIFRALACDYDGTLATADRIGPAALEALTRAREAGLKLILVTGRAFFELTRVCERLDLFDVVVAENGGVIYRPGSGAIYDQGPPPPMRLLAELDRRGIWHQLGRVVVGAARRDEDAVQEALEAAGITRELIVNRSALMLLAAGISKGTGVRQVMRDLGLSFHDVLALGDAENDGEFFSACGWAGCPGDAVPGIRERADWVFPGENGRSVTKSIGCRWQACVVSLVLVAFPVPCWAQPAVVAHSGTVTTVDRAAGTVTVEEIGPWRVEGGQTMVTPLTVRADGSTTWMRARRAAGAGPSGWDGEFVDAPEGAWEVKPGDYVTVEVPREGRRRVAVRVTVAELDTR